MGVSKGGQPGAETLESLYDKYYDRIYAFCVHRLFCRTAAEDVTSQVFLAAARGFDRINSRQEQVLAGWLYAIAVNQCNSHLRKTLRRRRLFERFQKEYCHHQAPDGPADWPAVYAAIARLREIEQTIITLRFFENLSYDAIASVVNKRETSVRVILHRGLKKLRMMLNSAACGLEDRGVHERA